MSDEQQPTKPRPQAGEFWQSGSDRVYIIGRTLYGRVVVQTQGLEVREQVLGDGWNLVPNCTGFDTSPRKTVPVMMYVQTGVASCDTPFNVVALRKQVVSEHYSEITPDGHGGWKIEME